MTPSLLAPETGRRLFLQSSGLQLGAAALAALLGPNGVAPLRGGEPTDLRTHHRPRAKRVIFLCPSGAPSQIDLFDPKPQLARWHGRELPESIRGQQRLTTMTADQKEKPVVASPWAFERCGASGLELSELLPHLSGVADELCVVRSLYTEAINHDPAITFLQTGSEQPGRPGWGAWISYALGSENENLPAFIVFISGGEPGDQPLNGRLWGAGFLPTRHQGVKFRSEGDPLLYLANPPGMDDARRRRWLAHWRTLNELRAQATSDPETLARIEQFELAGRMQSAVPELVEWRNEPEHVLAAYGDDVQRPGTFASHCLLARRMVERGVRFVQLYHRGWDHHHHLPSKLPAKCRQIDQPAAALVRDLKQRGLLDDTLVIWAGEFGRTVYSQGPLTDGDFGRDHHPRCFSIWLAGGGVPAGTAIGRTDDYSYNIEADPIHVHDLQATVLHLLGLDHLRVTYRAQGRDFRLTDIAGQVVSGLTPP
ncbi:MAG: DUF1501 domain-containing protein [Pirellulales bacterium]